MAHSLMESLVLERRRRTRVVRQKMMNAGSDDGRLIDGDQSLKLTNLIGISNNPAFIQDSSVYTYIYVLLYATVGILNR